jgi:methionyl-tRNA formyltransferase
VRVVAGSIPVIPTSKLMKPFKQDHFQATFTKIINKNDGIINLTTNNAQQIYNQFRAYVLFPGTKYFSQYYNQNIKITQCNSINIDFEYQLETFREFSLTKIHKKQVVLLNCANNTFLQISEVVLETGKKINFQGYSFALK